jgi:DNA-binding NarL/FixJ family response regulator
VNFHKHVLIADDSTIVRHILKKYLATRTDVVVCGEAVNGREAVQKAMTLKPDLVLLDLAMPEMNGAEVASVLKGAMPDIHVILFTMFGENIGKCLSSAIGVDNSSGQLRHAVGFREYSILVGQKAASVGMTMR